MLRITEDPVRAACDVASIMYTSGTSGPSKGVLMPHAHCFLFGLGTIDNLRLDSRDTYYVVLPLFHANGLFIQVYACLIAGARAVVRRRFSPSAWLQDVRRHGATITNTLGILSSFVFEQPAHADDRDHRLRLLMAAPNIPEHEAVWRSRFGIGCVLSGFGMTEANIPAWGTPEDTKPGTAGRVYARHFEVEIRDPDTDLPKRAGEVGEIMVRPRTASGFMAGYHAMPEKTVEAWRNLWFHTGDAGIIDEEGYLTFVDRIRDCIRRRGQNISSYEVEAAVMRVPGVAEVAAFAVPASRKGGEDEVMLAVVLEQGSGVTCADLAAHADADLPRFARPRFIEIVGALPKTPTGKVQKVELRKRPLTDKVWDREAPVGAREIELAGMIRSTDRSANEAVGERPSSEKRHEKITSDAAGAALLLLSLAAGAASAGPSGEVRIGILTDRSGPYADAAGQGSTVMAELAVEDFGGQLFGKPVAIVSADHQNKTDVGTSIARQWLDVDKVDAIFDTPNSGVMLAVQEVVRTKGGLLFASGGGRVELHRGPVLAVRLPMDLRHVRARERGGARAGAGGAEDLVPRPGRLRVRRGLGG